MSESEIKIIAKCDDVETAKKIETIISEAQKKISETDDEMYLHDYFNNNDLSLGIDFDSWWIPEKVKRNDSTLNLELIGSPSGTREQDIVTWLKQSGVIDISGEMIVDGGGDVEVMPL